MFVLVMLYLVTFTFFCLMNHNCISCRPYLSEHMIFTDLKVTKRRTLSLLKRPLLVEFRSLKTPIRLVQFRSLKFLKKIATKRYYQEPESSKKAPYFFRNLKVGSVLFKKFCPPPHTPPPTPPPLKSVQK